MREPNDAPVPRASATTSANPARVQSSPAAWLLSASGSEPCGCSAPQKGGLVRRYNVFQLLEKKGWRIAGIDLGEIYPNKALQERTDEPIEHVLLTDVAVQ